MNQQTIVTLSILFVALGVIMAGAWLGAGESRRLVIYRTTNEITACALLAWLLLGVGIMTGGSFAFSDVDIVREMEVISIIVGLYVFYRTVVDNRFNPFKILLAIPAKLFVALFISVKYLDWKTYAAMAWKNRSRKVNSTQAGQSSVWHDSLIDLLTLERSSPTSRDD